MKHKDKTEQIHLSEEEVAQNRVIRDGLKKSLDTEVKELDFISSSKLHSVRLLALEQLHANKRSIFTGFGKTGFALAASIILTVTLLTESPLVDTPQKVSEINPTAEVRVFESLNILASNDSVEFYQSLDFLVWLENESDT
ncbi:MAG: hypothetical protein GY820_29270 [Gammaproteobacteria bacterium]|nr:hypothetical protein [Gammaproteobacteria bacterium]